MPHSNTDLALIFFGSFGTHLLDQRQKSYECELAERLAEFSWFKKFSLRRKHLSAESVKNIQKQKIPRTAVSDPSEITVRGISCFCQPLIKFSQRWMWLRTCCTELPSDAMRSRGSVPEKRQMTQLPSVK